MQQRWKIKAYKKVHYITRAEDMQLHFSEADESTSDKFCLFFEGTST